MIVYISSNVKLIRSMCSVGTLTYKTTIKGI